MERVVNIAQSHKEAEEWDIRQQVAMSPQGRIRASRELQRRAERIRNRARFAYSDIHQERRPRMYKYMNLALFQSVDPGELHALTLLRCWHGEPVPAFCSGDRMAIVCLCLLGYSDVAVSVEELLSAIGLTGTVKRQFTKPAMAAWVEEGRRRYMQRSGLV